MFDCEHQLQLGVFENDTNVILVLLSSAVSMTTSVVCTGLQLQERIFKNLAAHIANQYAVIAHVENSHRGVPRHVQQTTASTHVTCTFLFLRLHNRCSRTAVLLRTTVNPLRTI